MDPIKKLKIVESIKTGLLLVVCVLAVVWTWKVQVYRVNHPEMTDTQLMFHLEDVLKGRK